MTKLWDGLEQVSLKPMHKVKVQTVTLTFNQATWFLFETHCLVRMIICAKLFSISLCMTNLWAGHKEVSPKPMHKVKVRAVILTYNLAICFLFATHCLVKMLICAIKFINPTMHAYVMSRTRTGFTETYT